MTTFAGITSPADELLVSVEDFAEWSGLLLDAAGEARAETALQIATSLIRTRTGRTLSAVTADTTIIDGSGRRLLNLPEYPIISIDRITEDDADVAATAYTYSYRSGIVERVDYQCWTRTRGGITVTYSHGYDPLPNDLSGVCLSFALRLYGNPDSASVVQETLGAYSVQYGSAGGIGLNDWELDVIKRYTNVAA